MFDIGPLTCNDVIRKFWACHDRSTMGMSSSLLNGSPADCPKSSNSSPPATLTGTCMEVKTNNHTNKWLVVAGQYSCLFRHDCQLGASLVIHRFIKITIAT